MSDRPVPARRSTLPALSIERELESAARYAASALAPATRHAYDRDWRVFAEWCVARGLAPMPAAPETVAAFLAAEADRDLHPVTIAKRAAAIAAAHRGQDQPNPCDSAAIAAVLAGIRRTRGTRPQRKAQALELEPLARMTERIDHGTLGGLRDRALTARLRRRASPLRARRARRRGPVLRRRPRAAGHHPPLENRPASAGRARRGPLRPGPGPMRGRFRALLPRYHRHRARPGVPADAPGAVRRWLGTPRATRRGGQQHHLHPASARPAHRRGIRDPARRHPPPITARARAHTLPADTTSPLPRRSAEANTFR